MKKGCLTLLLLCFSFFLRAQSILQQTLDSWSLTNTIEKLYIHTDRETYTAGDTVWLKGYFSADGLPSGASSSMHVQLIDGQGKVVSKAVFPANGGISLGNFTIPTNATKGHYTLSAFAPLMLNQPDFLFNKKIFVYSTNTPSAIKTSGSAQIFFFPEGGNLVSGVVNTVAFKYLQANGSTAGMTGSLFNNLNEKVADIQTLHDGMGKFHLLPNAGKTYYVTINGDAGQRQYALPATTPNGVQLSVWDKGDGKAFKIVNTSTDPAFRAAQIIGTMQNVVLFKQDIDINKNELSGLIPGNLLFSGMLQITAFNKDDMPLAERTVFVNNKEYQLDATFRADTLQTAARQKNRFSLQFKDSVRGYFSASVTDADLEAAPNNSTNIIAYNLLTSDIKGYVNNPAYYFSNNSDSVKTALDLLMMINGWTRFNWKDVKARTLPKPQFKDHPAVISGTVKMEGRKKPFANKDMMVWISAADSSKQMMLIKTDSLGQFKLQGSVYGNASIMFSDIRGRKSSFIEVFLDQDSVSGNYVTKPAYIKRDDNSLPDLNDLQENAYDALYKKYGIVLENVVVKAKRKNPLDELEDRYASGMFRGGINGRILDLREEIAASNNIFEYIQGRLPGVTVNRNGMDYQISYRNGNVSLFLDEMPTDASFIETIPITQIAYVKLYSNFVGATMNSSALAIYTKKGEDFTKSVDSPTDVKKYKGYDIVKEFYEPLYDGSMALEDKYDSRITLQWLPFFILNNKDPKIEIPFYNNDRTKRFKVTVEGITIDGKLFSFEKIVE